MAGKRDPLLKRALRTGYRTALAAETALTARRRRGAPRVWYAGARSGSGGGPLVKVARLREHFPEARGSYNLVYLLSNAPYLDRGSLTTLRRRKVPVVLNQNGVFHEAWFDGDWRAKNREMAAAYHLADHVFWQSDFCRRCAQRFLGERDGAGEVLFNAVDTGRFAPAARRPERPVTFLVAGKIEHHLYPRIGDALEAVARLRHDGRNIVLRIAGSLDARSESAFRGDVARLSLEDAATWTGPYSQQDAPDMYRSADVYLLTKPSDPCPNTVLEALACGLPVVYSATGGVPELVGEDAGWPLACEESFERMVWPSIDDLASAMAEAADAFGDKVEAARDRAVARYDIGHWIGRHRAVFEALLADRP
ncbi:MAG: glycosyltransferase family 4 protein [Rhodospirillales bacterium]|nr:glycosyltransferase family 4 protein [Rhodospirillales bacterium]